MSDFVNNDKPIHILLADDDSDDRFFFEKALKKISVRAQLTTVEDGEQLMNFLRNNSNLPDVIFLDLNMPRKKGSECLAEIKHDQKLRHIPVVIYSTAIHENIADQVYKHGAHYYLQKPNFTELTNAIQKTLILLKKNPSRPARNNFIIKEMVV